MQHTQEFGFSAVDHLFKLSLMYQEKVTIGLCQEHEKQYFVMKAQQ